EVAVTVQVVQEEFRRRPGPRLLEEVAEALAQPCRLPGPQQRQGRQPVARIGGRVVQAALPGQAPGQPLALAGLAHGREFMGGKGLWCRSLVGGRPGATIRTPLPAGTCKACW